MKLVKLQLGLLALKGQGSGALESPKRRGLTSSKGSGRQWIKMWRRTQAMSKEGEDGSHSEWRGPGLRGREDPGKHEALEGSDGAQDTPHDTTVASNAPL
jgi:hypothetical protein